MNAAKPRHWLFFLFPVFVCVVLLLISGCGDSTDKTAVSGSQAQQNGNAAARDSSAGSISVTNQDCDWSVNDVAAGPQDIIQSASIASEVDKGDDLQISMTTKQPWNDITVVLNQVEKPGSFYMAGLKQDTAAGNSTSWVTEGSSVKINRGMWKVYRISFSKTANDKTSCKLKSADKPVTVR